jgi:hypothetical protein
LPRSGSRDGPRSTACKTSTPGSTASTKPLSESWRCSSVDGRAEVTASVSRLPPNGIAASGRRACRRRGRLPLRCRLSSARRRQRGSRERVPKWWATYAACRRLRADTAPVRSSDRGERDHPAGMALTIQIVARESSRVGVRDECFAADADRVDRNHGDRFGHGASRSMASQLTRSTLAIHAFRSQAWPRRDHRSWAQGRSIPSEKR